MSNPLEKITVTSPFGQRPPVAGSNFKTGTNHSGVDLRAPVGTAVFAVNDGVVYEVGTNSTVWGTYVVIKGKDGYKQRYAHLSRAQVVKGQAVSAGQQIGLSGASGNVTGAHLHFGIESAAGAAVDPLAYIGGLQAAAQSGAADMFSNIKLPEGISGNMTAAAAIGIIGAALLAMSADMAK